MQCDLVTLYSDGHIRGPISSHPTLYPMLVETVSKRKFVKYSKICCIAIFSPELGLFMLQNDEILLIHSGSLTASIDSDCRFITFSDSSTHLLTSPSIIKIHSSDDCTTTSFPTTELKRIALRLAESMAYADSSPEISSTLHSDHNFDIPNLASFSIKSNKITIKFTSSRIVIHTIGESTFRVIDTDGESVIIRLFNPIGYALESSILVKFLSWVCKDSVDRDVSIQAVLDRNREFLLKQ